MKFIVRGFEKYNPRSDAKASSWFRLENDWLQDGRVFEWNNDKRIVWIYIIGIYSAKRNKGSGEIVPKIASIVCRVSENKLLEIINEFADAQAIELIEKCHGHEHHPLPRATATGPTNERTNERTSSKQEITPNAGASGNFDFNDAYEKYPRKVGKSAGLKTAQKTVKNEDDYNNLLKAINNYSTHVKGNDPKHIKHFSSFMSEWRDWIEYAGEKGVVERAWDEISALQESITEPSDYISDIAKKHRMYTEGPSDL